MIKQRNHLEVCKEKTAISTNQVLGDVLEFRQNQLIAQCEMLAKQIKQLHPWRAVDRRLIDALNEATAALIAVSARTTPHQQPSENGLGDDSIPF